MLPKGWGSGSVGNLNTNHILTTLLTYDKLKEIQGGCMKISVLGDGGWGTALSILLKNKGFDVSLWEIGRAHV